MIKKTIQKINSIKIFNEFIFLISIILLLNSYFFSSFINILEDKYYSNAFIYSLFLIPFFIYFNKIKNNIKENEVVVIGAGVFISTIFFGLIAVFEYMYLSKPIYIIPITMFIAYIMSDMFKEMIALFRIIKWSNIELKTAYNFLILFFSTIFIQIYSYKILANVLLSEKINSFLENFELEKIIKWIQFFS